MVVHITARVFEGLPFLPRRTMIRAIKGILARGQVLFPVTVCAFTYMGNHPHFILAGNGNRISPFMNFVQGEMAKAFEKFIPHKYRDLFWEDRFHEQLLKTEQDVIKILLYLYLNPVKAGLVSCADEYSELSSIKAFRAGVPSEELCSFTPSRHLKALHNTYNLKEDREEDRYLIKHTESFSVLRIEPLAWLKCFRMEHKKAQIQDQLVKTLEEQTIKTRRKRTLGIERVRAQPLSKRHRPPEKHRTPYIICYDKELRKLAIESYREFCHRCRKAWEALKQEVVQVAWPIGGYKPYHSWGPWRA